MLPILLFLNLETMNLVWRLLHILHTVGIWILDWSGYCKDTDPLYQYFMYSPASLLSSIYSFLAMHSFFLLLLFSHLRLIQRKDEASFLVFIDGWYTYHRPGYTFGPTYSLQAPKIKRIRFVHFEDCKSNLTCSSNVAFIACFNYILRDI